MDDVKAWIKRSKRKEREQTLKRIEDLEARDALELESYTERMLLIRDVRG